MYTIMKALNGFLMTQIQVTLKDVWGHNYNGRKLRQPCTCMSDAFLADNVHTTVDYIV